MLFTYRVNPFQCKTAAMFAFVDCMEKQNFLDRILIYNKTFVTHHQLIPPSTAVGTFNDITRSGTVFASHIPRHTNLAGNNGPLYRAKRRIKSIINV